MTKDELQELAKPYLKKCKVVYGTVDGHIFTDIVSARKYGKEFFEIKKVKPKKDGKQHNI